MIAIKLLFNFIYKSDKHASVAYCRKIVEKTVFLSLLLF